MHRSFPRTFAATVMPVMGVPTSPTMAMSPPAAPSAFLQHGAYSSATGVAGAALPSAPIRMPASAPRVISAKRNVATAAGDWPCPHCGGINFARRSECFKCRRAKGSAVGSASSHPTKSAEVSKTSNGEHGTWMCSCQTSNLITRDTCFMCQTPREAFEARSATPVATPAAEPDMIRITEVDTGAASQSSVSRGLGRSSTKKAGDWTCASCKGHNFASRELCFTCSAPKSEAEHIYTESSAPKVMSATSANQSARSNPSATGSGRKFAQMAGDWNCSGCGMHNFRNRETCRGCNHPKDDQAKVLTADDAMLPGDWKCPSCNEVNFRKREVCRACAVPKPTAAPAAAVAEASN